MATTTTTNGAPPARLKQRYLDEIRPQLMQRFGYSSIMQAPKLEKITLNMGVGDAKQDSKALDAAQVQLATIAGQRPSIRRARKSIAAFKLREGMPVGVAVTLRGDRGYEFLDRLTSIAIPRIRDFRGLSPRSFDGRGNYSMGVREQIIFPEIDYDGIDQVRGLDITITTTAASDVEAYALLKAFGMPFAAAGRPAGFDEPGEEPQADAPVPAAAAPADDEPPSDEPAAEQQPAAATQPSTEEQTSTEERPVEEQPTEATAQPADEQATEEQPADEQADDEHAPAAAQDAEPQQSAEDTTEQDQEGTD